MVSFIYLWSLQLQPKDLRVKVSAAWQVSQVLQIASNFAFNKSIKTLQGDIISSSNTKQAVSWSKWVQLYKMPFHKSVQ